MNKVDYSEPAVTLRIRQASQLRRLCLSLAKAGKAAAAAKAAAPPPRS
jgi:hypothetical protein